MLQRTPKWERELWSYVSNGDGDNCPVYISCQARLNGARCHCPLHNQSQARFGGGWCISGQAEQIVQVVEEMPLCASNYGFIERTRPGRIFELIELLAQSYLKKAKVSSPPVPSHLVEFADKRRDVEVRPIPLSSYHGAIWRLEDAWVIHVNEHDSPEKQRLTLFHEAFHILAHSRATPVFRTRSSEKGAFNELLAENFSYHVLMPRNWIEEKWSELKDVRSMAELFMVSEPAMLLRLKSLRLA